MMSLASFIESSIQSWTMSFLLNSLWQVPLLFAAGWLAARLLHATGAAIQHRVWVIAMLLETLLPACSTLRWDWLRALFSFGNVAGKENVAVVMGPGAAYGTLHLPGKLVPGITILYGVVIAYCLAAFLWRNRALSTLRNRAVEAELTTASGLYWDQCRKRFGMEDATLAASSEIFGPVTIGYRRKLVLLPVSLLAGLSDADLRTIIAHEFAHMRRNDFIKNLLYELLSLPVRYHPLFWLTRERLLESREIVCDEMAAESSGRTEYARSLLRLASLLIKSEPAGTPHAIGIFDANPFERRVMKLIERHKEIQGIRRAAAVAACIALAVGTCGYALAARININAPAALVLDHETSKPPAAARVSSGVMAANILTKVMPVYPAAAKKARIQGAVLLQAVISKEGSVESLEVISGHPLLRQSSLEAVSQWTYKPYLLNGEPVAVETTITVQYSLPE